MIADLARALARGGLTRLVRHNVYRAKHSRRALLSYIVAPFVLGRRKLLAHSNAQEVVVIADELHRCGFVVDVVDYRRENLPGKRYDLVIGFGKPLEASFSLPYRPKRFLYATGSYSEFQNRKSAEQLEIFRQRFSLLLPESARFNPETLPLQHHFSDALFIIGSEVTSKTFPNAIHPDRRAMLPSTFIPQLDVGSTARDKNWGECKNSFLWFGGKGAIHKGLPPLLEYFSEAPDLTLTICGVGSEESAFQAFLKNTYLNRCQNLKFFDFVRVDSDRFADLMRNCGFVILPSCSEGQASSVINVVANGGLLPIVTPQCGLPADMPQITIEDEDLYEGARIAIERARSLEATELRAMSGDALTYVHLHNSLASFRKRFRTALEKFLTGERT